MRELVFLFMLSAVLCSCGGAVTVPAKAGAAGQAAGKAVDALDDVDDDPAIVDDSRFTWARSLVNDYVKTTSQENIQAARKENSEETASFDRVESKDDRGYLVYKIGHKNAEDSPTPFTTDGWVYVDTLSHQLFVYDLAADQLSPYKK